MENNKVRIQDDLYHFVNQEKLDQLVIPDDKPTAGGFSELNDEVEKLMMKEFKDLAKSQQYPNELMEKAVTLYTMAKNVNKRNKQGIKPALKDLKTINDVKDIKSFNRKLHAFVMNQYPMPFNFGVDTDMMDSNKYCMMMSGPSTILPDTTYYAEGHPQKEMMLQMWKACTAKVMAFSPLSEEEQAQYIEDTLAFDAIVATLVKSSEEWSEYTKCYNPYPVNKVCRLLKPIKFKKTLEKIFGFVPETIIVADPRFLKGFFTLFNEETFTQYIHWAYVNQLLGSCSCLSEELRELGGAYRRALMGIAKPTEPTKFAYQLASRVFSEPIGLYYGEKYFGEEAKKDVIEMVHEIIDAYKERIAANDFLNEATKEKAILKLNTMKIKMGYPDKCDPIFDKLVVNKSDSLYKAYAGIQNVLLLDNFSKLTNPVDKTKWAMPGHMVNACYNPTDNDITFPAAILQAPFYSIKQTRSQNLGGIGAVIGHEISHAFDNNGAKCDENGNLKNWWTKEDFKKFDKKTKDMIKEFEGIELPWGKVNATLIVSENIADNGGMAVTLHIMKGMKDADYKEYFMNWARVWCQKAKDEYRSILLNVDVHAPVILRANMQPRNFPEWYEAFGVTKDDQMYLAPNKRVVIW